VFTARVVNNNQRTGFISGGGDSSWAGMTATSTG
jgi:hypothetical protein